MLSLLGVGAASAPLAAKVAADAEIAKVGKVKIDKPEWVSADVLLKQKDYDAKIEKQLDMQDRFKKLKQIIACLTKTT